MSQEITELKAAVEHGMRMYSAFANAKELVNALASAENYQAEVQARIDALKKEEADLIVSCNSQREITSNEIAHGKEVRELADAYAAKVKGDAEDDAKRIRVATEKTADEQRAAVEKYLAEANAKSAAQNEQIDKQETVLADLNAKIAEAQATIAKLLGK